MQSEQQTKVVFLSAERHTFVHASQVGCLRQSQRQARCFAALAAAALLLTGCSEGELLEVLVCGDLVESGDANAVRLSFLNDELIEQNAAVFDLASVRTWPGQTAIEVERSSGWIRATAIVAGAPSVSFDRRISELDRVSVVLERQCQGQTCARGQTCIAGSCTIAPTDAQAPNCELMPVVGP